GSPFVVQFADIKNPGLHTGRSNRFKNIPFRIEWRPILAGRTSICSFTTTSSTEVVCNQLNRKDYSSWRTNVLDLAEIRIECVNTLPNSSDNNTLHTEPRGFWNLCRSPRPGEPSPSPIENMTTEANPYQTPNSTQVLVDEHPATHYGRLATRYRVTVWLLAFLYPIWLLGSFYLTWLIAWVQLGHRPRPMLDDPKSIGGIVDIAYYIPGILMTLMPVLAPMGLAASFFCPINARRGLRHAWRAAFAVLYVVLCAIAFLTLRFDPDRVLEWWID
ncbi:MAG: hypothetical protein ACPIA2_13635, partial [Mariniblastus sp.]